MGPRTRRRAIASSEKDDDDAARDDGSRRGNDGAATPKSNARRPNHRRRKKKTSEETSEEEGGEEEKEKKSTTTTTTDKKKKNKMMKKKTKKKATSAVALSFEEEEEDDDDDDDDESKKRRKKKKRGLGALAVGGDENEKERDTDDDENRKYDADALKKELEAQRRVALNRPKEHEEATTTAAENNPFSREANDDDVVENVDDEKDVEGEELPSSRSILEAKLRRRANQTSGGKNYIPLDVGNAENKKTNASEIMMDIDDDGEGEENKNVPPSKRVVVGATKNNISSNKSAEERSNLALAKLQNAAQNAKRKLEACLENVERSNQASVRSSETLKSYEATLEESKVRYALAQELGVYFRALSGMLAEKLPMIEELEAQMLEAVKMRGKRRRETREHFKIEVGAETNVALQNNTSNEALRESELLNAVIRASGCEEVKMDELGRDVNLARKREVEKRCKSRFEAIKENAYERVVSTQFNVNDEDEKRNKFLERVQSISDIAKNVLFKDVDEEFASVRKILEKISKWESRDKKSHDDYLIYLADVFELFARVDLLKGRWITEVFCSSSSSAADDANTSDLVDFPWRNDIVEYVFSTKKASKATDTRAVALTNLMIEVYSRTVANLFAKCIDDENVWDVFEKPDRVAKSIQRVREDMKETILNEKDKKDETKGDKELIDLSHLQEMINEATLGIQRRLDDAVLSGEYPFWNEAKYAALVALDRKAIAKTFKAWKENEESTLELVAKTLEIA